MQALLLLLALSITPVLMAQEAAKTPDKPEEKKIEAPTETKKEEPKAKKKAHPKKQVPQASCTQAILEQNGDGDNALMMAAARLNAGMVNQLLKHGANANTQNVHGTTPAMYAVAATNKSYGKDPAKKATDEQIENSKKIITSLAKKGANFQLRDERDYNVLLDAIDRGNASIVAHLIENGAYLEERDIEPAITMAVKNDDTDMLELVTSLCGKTGKSRGLKKS